MMPRALAEQGLALALDQLLSNTFNTSPVKVNYDHQEFSHEVPKRVEVNLYRIAQELVQNILKHSQASEIDVMLYQAAGKTILCVEDNGIGIQDSRTDGHGMNNIKNRVNMFNGQFNFNSEQQGTAAIISIPTQNISI